MPRAPRFTTSLVRTLFRELGFAPAETRSRLMHAAEQLAAQIEPDQLYPQEFVTYRITGYRPDSAPDSNMVVGAALLRDLGTFVQELSRTLELEPDARGGAMSLEALADELNVSTKTLQRYRRQGLIVHYVHESGARPRLVCYRDAFESFRARRGEAVDRAGRFSRVDRDTEQLILDAARQLRGQMPLSRQAAARRLARRFDRAVETIRTLLVKHDQRADTPIFTEPGRVGQRERTLLERAVDIGVTVERIAHHLGRSTPTVRRLVNVHRAQRLRQLDLKHLDLPTFALDDAESIIFAPQHVRSGLATPGALDGMLLIRSARAATMPDADRTEQQLAAYHALLRRAASGTAALTATPSDQALDRIETDLRWAALLKRTIMVAHLGTALRRIDHFVRRPAEQLPAETLRAMLHHAVTAFGESIEQVDPSRNQSIDRVGAYAVDRALLRLALPALDRASVRHDSLNVDELFASLCPWQYFLEWRDPIADRLRALDGPPRLIMAGRYGLDGDAPLSQMETASRHDIPLRRVRRIERHAIVILAGRQADSTPSSRVNPDE